MKPETSSDSRQQQDTPKSMSCPPSRLFIVFLLGINAVQFALILKRDVHTAIKTFVTGDKTMEQEDTVFGHLHMQKTAGTSINGMLASRFERVCGHKGYSYDAYQFNKRVQATNETGTDLQGRGPPGDIIQRSYPEYSRGRVPPEVIAEIGYENCDWISLEDAAEAWTNVSRQIGSAVLELHIPCRDPISHLLSQCNHVGVEFDCTAPQLGKEIARCKVAKRRYKKHVFLESTTSSNGDAFTRLRCFNPFPIDGYLNYMSERLQRKRITNEYVHRETNLPRNKSVECLWSNPRVAAQVRKILLREFEYYSFCEDCMGSSDELILEHHLN